MAGLGLIGTALAGGAVGLGEASKQYADYASKQALQRQAEEAMKMRDERMAELQRGNMRYESELKREPYIKAGEAATNEIKRQEQSALTGTAGPEGAPTTPEETQAMGVQGAPIPASKRGMIYQEAYLNAGLPEAAASANAMAMNDMSRSEQTTAGFGHAENLAKINRDHAESLAKMTNDRIIAEGKLNRDQQLQLSRERMAELDRQFKNMGLSVQSTKDGLAIVDAKNQTATILKGPDGKPLMQLKEDDSLKLIGALGSLAKSAAETGDNESAKLYLDLARGAIQGKTGTAQSNVPQAAIDYLKKNPGTAEDFRRKFNTDPQQYLGGAGELDPSRFTTKKPAAMKADPQTGEKLDRSQMDRKYGRGTFDSMA